MHRRVNPAPGHASSREMATKFDSQYEASTRPPAESLEKAPDTPTTNLTRPHVIDPDLGTVMVKAFSEMPSSLDMR